MVAFAPGAVLTAANLNTAFNALTIRTVTGTSDTLVLADNGGGVTYSNASATTSTIPPNSSVAFAVGTKIVLINLGAGVVTVTPGAGVTVNGATLTLAQNEGGTCIKTATNTWSFLPFSSGVGAANFSNAATGTYTGFKYKTFTASGTLTIPTGGAGFADIIVVGGGGSFSGGAGGCLVLTDAYLPVGTLTVVVGAGGPTVTRNNGNSSYIGPYYGVGGGSGSISAVVGGNGGSGGGGEGATNAGGSGTAAQGNNGGSGASGATGGGGGASAVGANASASSGGNGGAGTTTTIAGTTPSGAYVAGSYAFGGGGGGGGLSFAGSGGSGGGGAGSTSGTATNGTANTGGGGGGTWTGTFASGGSGIVIVRVAV